MATPDETRRKAMDAVSHPETAALRRTFTRAGRDAAVGGAVAAPHPAPARPALVGEVKRRAMDAIANVQTVAQVGWVKMTGGIGVYIGRIREMDHEMHRRKAQRQPGRSVARERLGRDYE